MRKVWLVRHGNRLDFIQPKWFVSAQFPYDSPLCPAGTLQARELAQRLKSEVVGHIFVSPYRRTLETAMAVAIAYQLSLKVETGLGEWLNQDWMPGKPKLTSEPLQYADELIERNYKSFVVPQYPERRSPMLQRSAKTMQFLLTNYAGNLLVVGHKEPLIGCAIALLGKEPEFSFDVCAISEFTQTGKHWDCTLANDQTHLSDPGVKVAPCDEC
ncbi:Phosphoglycerate mutase [[Leptolyngbya] sp. PCC 7376]|uniref:histidine phosphatase family protein n=1 Tax=[Leptolyngbya] sp. PCC 7376 TaxID=111781 RepID=UPI00029EEDA1|nr:histidine phosphatase family protein [[Leptolyngbya] sp. PCC 7376]AFY38519.1 Phosphoglycerate mutase [[Leptolyngbya] sp. PCC 7376]